MIRIVPCCTIYDILVDGDVEASKSLITKVPAKSNATLWRTEKVVPKATNLTTELINEYLRNL